MSELDRIVIDRFRPHILFAFLIAGTIAYVTLLASVPPVDRDALTHHLFIPKLYLAHGGILELPHIPFSYYPMNLDLLYLIPLTFNNDIAPKFIHFVFALITAFMMFRYLSRRTSPAYTWLGTLFFLTLPVIVRLSSTVYVDLGLICFLFAALLYLFDWIESGFKARPLIISGVFCGLALGTKYNALVGLFLLGLFVSFVYARVCAGTRHVSLKAAAWGALFVLVSLLVFSPWMIRNLVWTGNPVYPLYNKIFNPPPPSIEKNDKAPSSRIPHIQVRRNLYEESWAQIALIPVRVFFQGKDDSHRLFDGRTSPFLLILPLCLIPGFRGRSRQEKTEILLMLFFFSAVSAVCLCPDIHPDPVFFTHPAAAGSAGHARAPQFSDTDSCSRPIVRTSQDIPGFCRNHGHARDECRIHGGAVQKRPAPGLSVRQIDPG